jgi:predicted transposase YbfD/YdcC
MIFAETSGYGLVPALVFSLMFVVAICCTTMMTLKVLIPKLLINRERRRYVVYYLLCSHIFLGSFAFCCTGVETWLCDLFDIAVITHREHPDEEFRYFGTVWFTYFICNVIAFRQKMQEDSRRNEILSIEKKEMEMKTLKSQINTHFLHNALNNIYSMIYFGNRDDAARYVMKLSQMLRYVLDDCEAEHVPIEKEIAYIRNYIDFQRARFDTDRNIRFNCTQHSSGTVSLPPMIFQPLMENCFQYCPLDKADNYVRIVLEAGDRRIRFTCENTQHKTCPSPDKKSNGIGLKNLNKRLYISYHENYTLNIRDEQDVFRVELIINV